MQKVFYFACLLIFATACKVQKSLQQDSKLKQGSTVQQPITIEQQAKQTILEKPELIPAHVGISLFDSKTGKFLYNYQSDKYFIPASNTKIFTCYAAMKNLGDSIVAFEYLPDEENIALRFTGDPSFLHPDFEEQPAYDFLKANAPKITIVAPRYHATAFGNGWAWNDYDADYSPERSPMPIYGNLVYFGKKGNRITVTPRAFKDSLVIFSSTEDGRYTINREKDQNSFTVEKSNRVFNGAAIPFVVKKEMDQLMIPLLEDTLNRVLNYANAVAVDQPNWKKFYSQPTDSLLKIMMHRSDNFFAEQTLLMVGNEKIGMMDDSKVIDTLLKSDMKGMPHQPRWVDGSGLSRYNMMTPQDFVWILNKMKQEQPWERIKAIFPTGNAGTLGGLYKGYENKIFAKTGTLTGHVALSGFVITNQGKELIFSIMVNAHQSAAGTIRKHIEQFLTTVINEY
ncbi:D-alanyl-D-alanine carboxypeptidase/D-alanyl-D-alanine-endopeptidase [Sediminibacterium sp.]|uniref:D-alanyl-D-alanine carboxypeptidase/D-alanyl-D-alanine endopeptidase n=1 Tax=Sediminibacterium sp. TaxID=1917865 RepID=UPI0025D2506B|nr:D-alanyl-D-alanine carboxypeptidase/D-alanyl-D-alanine-endopeptidase [Sediminibacterium sp.]